MQLTTTHKIDAASTPVSTVTVFRSACAEIVRRFTIALKTGENNIDITSLPSSIVTESLRVSGFGAAMLSDVVCTVPPSDFKSPEKSDYVRELEAEKARLDGQRRVVDHQADILLTYAKSLNGEYVKPDEMAGFLEKFLTIGKSNVEDIQDLDKRVAEIEKKLKKEREDPTEKVDSSSKRKAKVRLVINAEDEHEAEISLTYLVNNVKWESAFDLRAATDSEGKVTSKVALHYRASITQSTGEDWDGVVLILSTAHPTTNTTIPVLKNLKIKPMATSFGLKPGGLFGNNTNNQQSRGFGGFAQNTTGFGAFSQQQQAPAPPLPAGGLFGSAPHAQVQTQAFGQPAFASVAPSNPSAGGFGFGTTTAQPTGFHQALIAPLAEEVTEEPVEEIGLPQMEIPSAVASENAVAATFQVKGTTNIPSDGVSHKVAIAILNLQAKIEQIAVPRSVGGAYIQCTVNNSSNTHLLPGKMSLFLDEGYIANSSISHVAPGENFICSLGQDHSVRLLFHTSSKKSHQPQGGLFSAANDKVIYTTTITLKNKRANFIKGLIVRDVAPISENKDIKVVLTRPAGLAETEEGKDLQVEEKTEAKGEVKIRWRKSLGNKGGMKEGRFEWVVDLEAKEEKVLVLEWEVITPFGMRWNYVTEA